MNNIKVAAAPISWGVCEVPNWGYQMSLDRVLTEMKRLGFEATELGPEGFLPEDPAAKAKVLADYGIKAVGGFVPVLLHDSHHDPLPQIKREIVGFTAVGGKTLVLSAITGTDGYDAKRPELDESGWEILFSNVDRILEIAEAEGLSVALHPHAGTMIETQSDLNHILEGTSVKICFDTGHMFIGGIDPVAFAKNHAERVSHAHLKDVKLDLARKVQTGEQTYYNAVVEGMYVPLGSGDVDIRTIVSSLEASGFKGWYVLEQDNVVYEDPAEGEGPINDARASLDYLYSITA